MGYSRFRFRQGGGAAGGGPPPRSCSGPLSPPTGRRRCTIPTLMRGQPAQPHRMRRLPTVRTATAVALVVAIALPVAANIDGPDPQSIQPHPVKTGGKGSPYATGQVDVYVKTGNLTRVTTSYLEDVDAALRYWETVDDGRVAWLDDMGRTVRRDEAEIVLELHHTGQLLLQTPRGPAPSLGLGAPGNATTAGQVDLTTRVGCTDIYRSHAQVESLARHEVGHALGLDHTSERGDPMRHGGLLAGVPNPLEIAVDSPNGITGRVAGLVAPVTALPSCHLG